MLVEATLLNNSANQRRVFELQKNTLLTFHASWPVFWKYLNDGKSFLNETFRKDFTQKDTFYAKKIKKKEQKLVELFQFCCSQETRI